MTQRTYRLAAVCFADIAGYTELSARNEGEAVAVVELLQEIARQVVGDRGGRVVKFIGDAVLAEFPSTHEAVRWAIDLRDRFVAGARSQGLESRDLRVGVHVGDILTTADGDIYGDGVNIASRIQTAAQPGQVWVSEDVWRQLHQRPEFRFESRGEHALKGVSTPVGLYGVRLEPSARPARPPRPAAKAEAKASPRKQSVAVLPFTNMSASAENEYFSDGVTEEILTLLARIEGLKVISRTSVMRYKGTDKPMRQIADELGVASILEGSVRQAGRRVRISAQLINAATDEHLWAERYDRDLEDIFAIQTDVAERIVEALRVRLTPREQAQLVKRPTESVEAYQSYLKGRYFLSRRTEASLRQAIEWFRTAVAADLEFAQAWAGLADAYAILPSYSATPTPEACAEGRVAAGRALALNPGLGEAHAALGVVAENEWNWEEAEREFRHALELSPGNATAFHWYGNFLSWRGRTEEALAALRQALELDPVSLPIHIAMGVALNFARRFDAAIDVYRKAIEMDPGYVTAHYNLAFSYLCQRRFEDALIEWETVSRLNPGTLPPDLVTEARQGYASGGEPGFWEAYLEGLRSRPWVWGRVFVMSMACAQLGRKDEAFALIDEFLAERSGTPYQISTDPLFVPLRSDPRYVKVLERLRLR
ncbi:MAG TPA: tetratricopeptide repeat protein [Gemmatimonadota bacterium]|jgi:TolB-like protein/class 3 adenylate cyclase/tetratricopeptide (TPR) repeat protein